MPVLYSTAEMSELAQKLAKWRFGRAKWHIRGMDKRSNLELWRNALEPGRWVTRFALPTLGLLITLVEIKEEYGAPNSRGYRKNRFRYVEAHVETLPVF